MEHEKTDSPGGGEPLCNDVVHSHVFLLIHSLLYADSYGSMCIGSSMLLYQLGSGIQPSVVGFSDSGRETFIQVRYCLYLCHTAINGRPQCTTIPIVCCTREVHAMADTNHQPAKY